jgi:hypothetical protein
MDEDRTRDPLRWPSALLPGLLLTALLTGGALAQASAEEPAGRTVLELEVTDR